MLTKQYRRDVMKRTHIPMFSEGSSENKIIIDYHVDIVFTMVSALIHTIGSHDAVR